MALSALISCILGTHFHLSTIPQCIIHGRDVCMAVSPGPPLFPIQLHKLYNLIKRSLPLIFQSIFYFFKIFKLLFCYAF